MFTTQQWNVPQEEDIAWADLVSIDPQFGNADREALFRQYAEKFPGLLIFTRGEKPFWYFRAGLAHGRLQRWSDERMLRFSAAAAALNCTRFPGVKHSPCLQEVVAFCQ